MRRRERRLSVVSGMDGIIAVLNQRIAEETGKPGKFTATSKVVKRTYDGVQKAYDGAYDPQRDCYTGYRRTFFRPAEPLAMARAFEAET